MEPLNIRRPRHCPHSGRFRQGADQARGGGPHSGPALGGQSTLIGARVAAQEINGGGGLLGGRKIEIVAADTRGIPAESERAYRRLVTQDKVVGVVCCWFSASTIATLPTIEELKIPTTTGVAYLPDAKETKLTYLFKFGHTPRLEFSFRRLLGQEAEREEGGLSGSRRRLGPRHVQRLPSPAEGAWRDGVELGLSRAR